MIAADSPTHAPWVCFLGPNSSDDAEIRCCTAFGNVGHLDEIHGFGPFLVTVALNRATNFVGIGALPEWTFTALVEFAVLCKFA